MPTPIDAASLVLELLSWIGIATGVVLLIAGYLRRLAMSGWIETTGVIVVDSGHEAGRSFRWLGDDGNLYDLPADTEETAHLEVGDDVLVYVNPRRADQARTDTAHHEGRPLRLLGWILFGVGIASVAISLVLAVVE
jgi:hypothetical protein